MITDFCYNHSLDVAQCHSTLGAVFHPNIANDEAPQEIPLNDDSNYYETANTAASSCETLSSSEEGQKMQTEYDDVEATNEYGAASHEYHDHATHADKWADEEIMHAATAHRCPKPPQVLCIGL